MAHHFLIQTRPHKNKDGTFSEFKKDYVVIHRGRGGRYEVGVAPSKVKAEEIVAVERQRLIGEHMEKNPSDQAFINKHTRKN